MEGALISCVSNQRLVLFHAPSLASVLTASAPRSAEIFHVTPVSHRNQFPACDAQKELGFSTKMFES